MVKSLISIAVAAALLCLAAVFEWVCVENNFKDFGEELQSLSVKIENETASGEDAKAVQSSWERRKEELYVWIPHNDIARIDDYMSETVRLVSERDYPLARAKVEIITHLCGCLPDTYRPHPENIL